jgi:hypothetical protein
MSAAAPAGLPSSNALDLELMACATPYQSFAELLADFGAPVDLADSHVPGIAEVAIWPPAAIEEGSNIEQGKLRIEVTASPGIDTSALRVGVKAFPTNEPHPLRFSINGSELTWLEDAGVMRGSIVRELPQTPVALTLLSLDGELLVRWWVRDPGLSFNDRLQLHRQIDTQSVFEKTFFADKNEFEERINLLLTLLGLTVLKYGEIKPLTDAPDILATSGARDLYAIECKTGDINKSGKLHRLHERTKAIANATSQTPAPFSAIQPVIITSLSRAETVAHWATAESFQIALVCREDLESLLQRLGTPPSAEELLSATVSCIPSARADQPEQV